MVAQMSALPMADDPGAYPLSAHGPNAVLEADPADGRSHTSVAKALALLDAFDQAGEVRGISELAKRVNLPKSTTHRLLTVLIERGYVEHRGERYCLSDRVFELGHLVDHCQPAGLRERAIPFMAELFVETGATIHLGVLKGSVKGSEVLYLDKIFGHDGSPVTTTIGARKPAYCTALGKAVLAYSKAPTVESVLRGGLTRHTPYTLTQPGQLIASLQRVHAEGIATDFEECQVGVTCLAVPLFAGVGGVPLGALSICTRAGSGDVRRFAARLLRAGRALSWELNDPGRAGC